MPYKREGAIKISDHHVRSPVLNLTRACQTCHRFPEEELKARVEAIQDRTKDLLTRAEGALLDLMDTIAQAKKSGLEDKALTEAQKLHRRAQWRVDFIAAENSLGFHAPQESARILGEAIDFARLGQIKVLKR